MNPRCSACPNTHRQVGPSGPRHASIVLIGEGPGRNEDQRGVPFVGVSGLELDNTYLRLAGLDRGDIFVTNCVQCRCERNGTDVRPSDSLLKICAENHIPSELSTVNPDIVILCGGTACSLVPDIDLELEHGFPREAGIFGWRGWVVPMYHPAAGMHESRFMIPMLEDWEKFGLWLRKRWTRPHFLGENRYQLLFDPDDVWESMRDDIDGNYERLAIDTESDEGKLFSIQYSPRPGVAFMILSKDELIDAFSCALEWNWGSKAVLHNAIYDLDELDRAGCSIREFRDTMQELYHLGNLPQGLKAAVYRIFGYKMTSYDETVTPYSKRELETWLACSLAHASSEMRTEIPHPAGKGCPSCGKNHRLDLTIHKPHECEAVLRRIMGRLGDGDTYDPWEEPKVQKGVEKARLLGRDWLRDLEAATGRMPRRSIVHVPLEHAVQYGCSDADWTGRLAAWLEGERKRIVENEWKVA